MPSIMNIRNFRFSVLLVILFALAISCNKDDKLSDPVTDIEGNIYNTVNIGSQVWMLENLKTGRYNDGTDIPLVTDSIAWQNLSSPGYCWYNNDKAAVKNPYGALYNGYTINTGKLCPAGWHVPYKEELVKLRDFLGDSTNAGGRLKEAGIKHWFTPNKGADNGSGFTALPSGIRYFEGTFSAISYYTGFWSDTGFGYDQGWFLNLYFGDAKFNISHTSKTYGLSVRCIKN
jgi:uncharacterized protein (TIGR02145 family)